MKGLAIVTIVAFAAACSDPVSVPPREWEATLVGTAAFPGVSGTASATATATQTIVTATIAGAVVGSVLPWHIHFGTCEDDQGIVGDPGAYPFLEVDATGTATAAAGVAAGLQAGADYFVNVHAAPDNLPTIVACGQLELI